MSKKVLIALVILLSVCLINIHSHQILNQDFEYTSAPGAPDLIEMLGKYDDYDWHIARRYIQTIKFYYGQVWKDPNIENLRIVQGNSYYNLVKGNVFLHVRRNFEMKTAIEIGAMKPHNCLFIPDQIKQAVDDTVEAVMAIYEAGGSVNRLDIDNSIGHCRATIDDSSFATSRFMMLTEDAINSRLNEMKKLEPDLPVVPIRWAEIEAYPAWSIKEHLRYIYRLNLILNTQSYLPLEVYFLDIDHSIVNDRALTKDFEVLLSYCHLLGIKVGVIINGDDENPKNPWINKDLDYLRSANDQKLVRFKRIGILNKADVIMVQSWAIEANGGLTVPRNVPETGITGTNFFIHTLKCAAGIVDCSVYPELE